MADPSAITVVPTSYLDSAVQTDVSAFSYWSDVLLCDAATQTADIDYVQSLSITSDASTLGMASLNNGTASSLTDPSNDSSMITVINQADVRPSIDKSFGLTANEVDDDDGAVSYKEITEENGIPVIHSRGESQRTQSRQPVGTLPQEIFQDQSQDGDVTMPLLCPAGLECLLDTSQLVMHTGNFRHDLFFNVKNIRRMEAINEMRRVLFYIEQDPPPPLFENSFLFRFYNRNKQEVMQVYNPASHTCLACGLSWQWFRFCRFQAVVYSPPGTVAGFIKRQQTCFVQEFEILGPCEEVLLRLRGSPTDLKVYSVDLQHELGRLSIHGWVGVMHEIRRTAGDYGLTFPIDLDVRVKALLLSSVIAIDWLYSTEGGRK